MFQMAVYTKKETSFTYVNISNGRFIALQYTTSNTVQNKNSMCISCYAYTFISSIFNNITFVLNHFAIYVETVHSNDSTSRWNGECLANAILPNKSY